MNIEESKFKLIKKLILIKALKTDRIINAFKKVKRERFVLPNDKEYAYEDYPLMILEGQTISQPFTVAVMTEALDLKKGMKVLEVGCGTGYQSAIISEIVGEKGLVVTIERHRSLYDYAKTKLKDYKNIICVHGDGSLGVNKYAPYDRIIVTASAPKIPEALKKQLKINGLIIIPIKKSFLEEYLLLAKKKNEKEFEKTNLGPYAFVPLIGKDGFDE